MRIYQVKIQWDLLSGTINNEFMELLSDKADVKFETNCIVSRTFDPDGFLVECEVPAVSPADAITEVAAFVRPWIRQRRPVITMVCSSVHASLYQETEES